MCPVQLSIVITKSILPCRRRGRLIEADLRRMLELPWGWLRLLELDLSIINKGKLVKILPAWGLTPPSRTLAIFYYFTRASCHYVHNLVPLGTQAHRSWRRLASWVSGNSSSFHLIIQLSFLVRVCLYGFCQGALIPWSSFLSEVRLAGVSFGTSIKYTIDSLDRIWSLT